MPCIKIDRTTSGLQILEVLCKVTVITLHIYGKNLKL